jgi:hypothetical protein
MFQEIGTLLSILRCILSLGWRHREGEVKADMKGSIRERRSGRFAVLVNASRDWEPDLYSLEIMLTK